MTVGKYVAKMGAMPAFLDAVDVWSNAAASGYAITAMRAAGVADDVQRRVLDAMNQAFDALSVDDAERVYNGW